MNDRDCANCGNRSDRGCKVWECEFKPVFSESKQPIIEELKKIKVEIEEIKMKKPLMSKGFECYGFKDKTPEDIKTEIIEMLDNRIEELKEGAE